jgi:two-component system, sensor histidine kinase and response regulator
MYSKERQYTILTIDDTTENIDIIINALADKYFVQAAVNGKRALKMIEKKIPDLILLDIMMPEMDGYEVCRRLKADESTREIPIIFLTAKVEIEDETKGLELGAVDYITKPISPSILIARVQTHLRIKEANNILKRKNELLEENARLHEDVERITQHDLKSPLNPILGYAQLMRLDDNLTEEQLDYLYIIESSCHKLLDMINLSLDLYKIENGTYVVKTEIVDLSQIITAIIEENRSHLKSKSLIVDTFINGCPAVDGVHFNLKSENLLIYSMLSNLFKNAMEASPKNERITIVMENDEKRAMSIHNMGDVPNEIRSTFFEKYATAKKYGGTGLGTYSARLIAETIGGQISLDTSTENGTTICIEFSEDA